MVDTIENAFLQLNLNPARSVFSLFSRQREGPFVEDGSLSVSYRLGGRKIRSLVDWGTPELSVQKIKSTPHGKLHMITTTSGPDQGGVLFHLSFALPEGQPMMLWHLNMENRGKRPLTLDRVEMLRVGFPRHPRAQWAASTSRYRPESRFRGTIRPHAKSGSLAFLSNGWASWAFNGVYDQFDRSRQTRLGFLRRPSTTNAGSPLPRGRGHFSSEMFGVLGDRTHRSAILAGYLSQREQFGTVEVWADPLHPTLRMLAHGDGVRLDPGKEISTDWACLSFLLLDNPDPLGLYLDAVAREHQLSELPETTPTGWCSWYHYFDAVDQEAILENLKSAQAMRSDLPLDLIQIDDGFETRVGDWFSFRPTFPEGPAILASRIEEAGFTPGLWLAPFILERSARLLEDHPEWILRNRLGVPVNAGYNWNGFTTALDLTHPGALAYTAEVVHTAVHQWGFPYLKLDFLYAGALPGWRQDPTRTRAQVLRSGLQALREAAGDQAFLLACGCPLGSAIGLVEAMRIGPDTAPDWPARYRGIDWFFRQEPDIPAAVNSLQSTLVRAPLHRRWWINDPDCLLVRPETSYTEAELQTLATAIALTGGSFFISDNLAALPDDRIQLLEALLPPIGKTPHLLDWFDSQTPARLQLDLEGPAGPWHLIALFNWGDHPADLVLNLSGCFLDSSGSYLGRSFWDGRIYEQISQTQTFNAVPAHGVVLLALRKRPPRKLAYLGSSLHISQGLELSSWDIQPDDLSFSLQRPGNAQGEIVLSLPRPPVKATLNTNPLTWQQEEDHSYRFPVTFDGTAHFRINLQTP